jgi:large subunit ribosomal protein L28e
MSGTSQDLQWLLVRTNTAFLVKQQGLPRIFTREPSNLRQIHSYTYSGLVNDKRVGVEAAHGGRGVVITTRKSKAASNAIKGSSSTTTM